MFPNQIYRVLILFGLLLTSLASSQPMRPTEKPAAPIESNTFELDKQGKRKLIDFNISMKPIINPNIRFSQYAKKKLMIFYFSVSCSHCQHTTPFILDLSTEIARHGFSTIAIAIKNNTESDIRDFVPKYHLNLPLLQDVSRNFGDKYGTGSIPLIFLVNEKGEYIRYTGFYEATTPNLIRESAYKFSKK